MDVLVEPMFIQVNIFDFLLLEVNLARVIFGAVDLRNPPSDSYVMLVILCLSISDVLPIAYYGDSNHRNVQQTVLGEMNR